MVLLGLEVGEVGEVAIEGGLEVEGIGLEVGEVGGEGEVLLLQEGARLLRRDGGRVLLRPDGLQLPLQVPDEGVGFLRHQRPIVGAPRQLVIGDEQRHRRRRRRRRRWSDGAGPGSS